MTEMIQRLCCRDPTKIKHCRVKMSFIQGYRHVMSKNMTMCDYIVKDVFRWKSSKKVTSDESNHRYMVLYINY